MNKLTAIKIKYNDGRYSDEIPIGVFAENVKWNNNLNLTEVLGNVKTTTAGTVQDQIDALVNEKADVSDVTSLGARVTALEAGGGGGSGGSSTLAGLTDTSISNKVDGQVLTYDNTSHKWVNKMPIGADNSLVVNVSGTGTYRTCDKTYTEIYNAISTGKTVVAVDGTGVVYPYAGLMEQNGAIAIALGISVVYNKTATLTGYLIVDMHDGTMAVRQDQSSSFYDTTETYTRQQIDAKIGDIETLLAAI